MHYFTKISVGFLKSHRGFLVKTQKILYIDLPQNLLYIFNGKPLIFHYKVAIFQKCPTNL